MTDVDRLKLELAITPSDLGLSNDVELTAKLTAFLDLADTLRPTATNEQKYQHAKALTINAWIKQLSGTATSKTLGDYSVSNSNGALLKLLRMDYIGALREAKVKSLYRPSSVSLWMDASI